MPMLGREFGFAFSHSTRVDLAFGHLGSEPAEVELRVHDDHGVLVYERRFLDVPGQGAVSTRHDSKADNLARFVGANLAGYVTLRGSENALLSASYLCIGKGITCCAVLPPLALAARTQIITPIAMGQQFLLVLANPYATEAQVSVEVAAAGEPFRPLQDPLDLPHRHVRLTEDAMALGKPAIVKLSTRAGAPILAWGLGIGRYRSELYPLHG
jgi:hypothetical protein